MKIMTATVSTALVAMLAIAPMAYAQNAPAAPGGAMMQGPHEGMLARLTDACKDKKADAPCSFTRRNGETANGTCETRRGRLLCVPAGMMMHHGAMGGGTMGAPGGAAGPPSNQ